MASAPQRAKQHFYNQMFERVTTNVIEKELNNFIGHNSQTEILNKSNMNGEVLIGILYGRRFNEFVYKFSKKHPP